MMKMKKFLAAVLAVAMTLSMLSAVALGTSAEEEATLGGPVQIKSVSTSLLGISVPGKDLPAGILVVDDNWTEKSGVVSIQLNGITYRATIGQNAFQDIALAIGAATTGTTIYVAPGFYETGANIMVGHLNIYGPYAGVNPNLSGDLSKGNPARPSAIVTSSADATDEAVFSGVFSLYQLGSEFTVDGLYFADGGGFTLGEGGKDRTGTYIRNNIVNVTKASLSDMNRGRNYSYFFEKNRVLNGMNILNMGGINDVTIRNNYLNLSDYTAKISSVQSGSMGAYCKVESNYFENCSGVVQVRSNYQTALFSVQVLNNYVKQSAAVPLVETAFYGINVLPGTNVQVKGNTFMGMKSALNGVFYFPFTAYEGATTMYRYMININENKFDLPAASSFINSGMDGVLNCAYNYYTNGITASQITTYKNANLILYPYYADAAKTTLLGDARITGVNLSNATIDQANKTIFLDMRESSLEYIDMTAALVVSNGCTWKLFEDQALTTEITNKKLYYDGVTTYRYVEVFTPDGYGSNVYCINVTRNYSNEAKMVDVLVNSPYAVSPVIDGNTYRYDLPADAAFLTYTPKLSSGATYKLYADSALTKALPDIGSYIPYGGYQVYVLVTSEDQSKQAKYCLDFERNYSAYYDPCIIAGTLPQGNYVVRQSRHLVTYYCGTLLAGATFDFKVTPGATYTLYKDAALTQALSASGNLKEIPLAEGRNTFYVKVTDSTNTNTFTLLVENGVRSSDSAISGLNGAPASITGNVIEAVGSGSTTSIRFLTNSAYATCKVYADSSKQIAIGYTSTPVTEAGSIHVIDDRTFNLTTELPVSLYFVECMAENGAIQNYTLFVVKSVTARTYTDVADDAWYAPYVREASDAGLLNGEENGVDAANNTLYRFRPDSFASRQELAAIMCRLIGVNKTAFESFSVNYADLSQIADWSMGYVKACAYFKIMNGSAVGNQIYFLPNNNISRQEVMAIFARAFGLQGSYDLSAFPDGNQVADWARSEVEAVVAAGIIVGNGGYLKPNDSISRAEIATVLMRAVQYSADA